MMRRSPWKFVRVVFIAGILACALMIVCHPQSSTKSAADRASSHVLSQLGKLPLYFIENQGQLDQQVGYYVKGKDNSVYFTSDGVVFALTEEDQRKSESPFRSAS